MLTKINVLSRVSHGPSIETISGVEGFQEHDG